MNCPGRTASVLYVFTIIVATLVEDEVEHGAMSTLLCGNMSGNSGRSTADTSDSSGLNVTWTPTESRMDAFSHVNRSAMHSGSFRSKWQLAGKPLRGWIPCLTFCDNNSVPLLILSTGYILIYQDWHTFYQVRGYVRPGGSSFRSGNYPAGGERLGKIRIWVATSSIAGGPPKSMSQFSSVQFTSQGPL